VSKETVDRKSWALWAVVGFLLVVAGVGVWRFKLKRDAEYVLRASSDFSLQPHPPTVQQLRERFGRALRQTDPCAVDGCQFELFLSNSTLATIRLLPYTVVRSTFWVNNSGVVQSNSLQIWTVIENGSMRLSYILVKYCVRCDSFIVNPYGDSSALGVTGSVEIGSAAPRDEKLTAIALNTDCLTRWHGCVSVADLMPRIWEETPTRTIRCRLANHDGFVDAAARPIPNPQ